MTCKALPLPSLTVAPSAPCTQQPSGPAQVILLPLASGCHPLCLECPPSLAVMMRLQVVPQVWIPNGTRPLAITSQPSRAPPQHPAQVQLPPPPTPVLLQALWARAACQLPLFILEYRGWSIEEVLPEGAFRPCHWPDCQAKVTFAPWELPVVWLAWPSFPTVSPAPPNSSEQLRAQVYPPL